MRSNIINGVVIQINSNTTPTTASTILAISKIANNIISKMIENSTEYINNTIINENKMRNEAKNNSNIKLIQELENSADKLVISRNAITSIINKKDVDINYDIIKSLVKSDLLREASYKVLASVIILLLHYYIIHHYLM